MRQLIFIFLTAIIISCKSTHKTQYIEGLVNCHTSNKKITDRSLMSYEAFQPKCLIGVQMPSFKATTIAGKLIDDAYFKGKVTIVNFWFASCQPCVAEIPGFNQLVKKYGKKKVSYLAIGRDKAQDIDEFLDKHPWDFDHVANGEKLIADVFDLTWGYPFTFLVNEDSKIVMAFTGGFDDERATTDIQNKLIPKIEELLK
ncbi:MAG: TlpA family protein disulfide reductase [Bacteroidetes bacterium]|nr:TlpA family protein disulfide reductase [Bacteroidota bacterium]